jgi:phosphoribosylaminoimidazole (AIR) synthetase
MGIGFICVVRGEDAERASQILSDAGETVYAVGQIVVGERGVEYAEA